MLTAAFGLLGVIVGGVLGGLVQLWIERHRSRDLGEAAAALISEELLTIARRGELFVERQIGWEAVISTDAWDAYKTAILLAVPRELGSALVTAYGFVGSAPLTVSKRDRAGSAFVFGHVARLTGEALLLWRRSGTVDARLSESLERGMAEAEALFAERRVVKLLEAEERWLLKTTRWIERLTPVVATLSPESRVRPPR